MGPMKGTNQMKICQSYAHQNEILNMKVTFFKFKELMIGRGLNFSEWQLPESNLKIFFPNLKENFYFKFREKLKLET